MSLNASLVHDVIWVVLTFIGIIGLLLSIAIVRWKKGQPIFRNPLKWNPLEWFKNKNDRGE